MPDITNVPPVPPDDNKVIPELPAECLKKGRTPGGDGGPPDDPTVWPTTTDTFPPTFPTEPTDTAPTRPDPGTQPGFCKCFAEGAGGGMIYQSKPYLVTKVGERELWCYDEHWAWVQKCLIVDKNGLHNGSSDPLGGEAQIAAFQAKVAGGTVCAPGWTLISITYIPVGWAGRGADCRDKLKGTCEDSKCPFLLALVKCCVWIGAH